MIPADLTAFWSSDAAVGGAGTSAAWTVTTDTGVVTRFDSLAISTTVTIDDLVCVYQPASKNG